MSQYNTPERCIELFLKHAKESKDTQFGYASPDFLNGMQHVINLANIWFSDQVKKEEDEPCAKV